MLPYRFDVSLFYGTVLARHIPEQYVNRNLNHIGEFQNFYWQPTVHTGNQIYGFQIYRYCTSANS
jgi:hypothetical protein